MTEHEEREKRVPEERSDDERGEHGEQSEDRERLSRFLAHAGVASRRHAEALIAAGRVQVNGMVITTQGIRIDPVHDRVLVDGKPIESAVQHIYIALHKPAGYVSTASDQRGRPTVLDLLPTDVRQLRVYPVGRLDIDTSGLLLLTNDGDFALHLTHPRFHTAKHYEVLVQGHPLPTTIDALRKGVEITEDGGEQYTTAPAKVRLLRVVGPDCWLALTIHEGHKRQIRRMLNVLGHRVLQLTRVGVGSLTLRGLPVGAWRYLTQEEVMQLME